MEKTLDKAFVLAFALGLKGRVSERQAVNEINYSKEKLSNSKVHKYL
jgi:hypothetical protein